MNDTNTDDTNKIEKNEKSEEKFPIEKMKIIIEKIGLIKDEVILRKIKDVITLNNPNLEITKNSNGIFLRFQHLKYNTYIELEKLLNRLERKKVKTICSETSPSSSSENKSSSKQQKKLRLTNVENHIINRAKYEKQLRKNEFNEEDDTVYPKDLLLVKSDNDIFVKNPKKNPKM
jgi:hypothetical protein